MSRLEEIQKILRLSNELDRLENRFRCPFSINKDFKDLTNCVFDCIETREKELIHKAAQTMVYISDTILSSDAFPEKQKYLLLLLLDYLAQYCAQWLFSME